jgi:GTPase
MSGGSPRFSPPPAPPLHRGERSLPIVAIVGRPNVGKSTLFNRLARTRAAIVHDEPGVTRDRHYAMATAFGRSYLLVDTGGFDPESHDRMKSGIAGHVKAAIAEADVVVFVTDNELTSADRAAVSLLRGANKPVLFVSNKADNKEKDADAFELYRLGAPKVLPLSALHGRGMAELERAIVASFPPALPPGGSGDPPPSDESPAPDEDAGSPSVHENRAEARVAIIGKPNAGKSSLLNRLLGQARMLVDPEPGTTRDAIDTRVTRGDKSYLFIDTAGIRKKGRVTKAEDAVESMSVLQAIRAIERSNVCVLVCDAKEGVAEQDAKIVGLAEDRRRALVIALNKSDLLSKDEWKRAEEKAREKISFVPYVPIVLISAKTGRGVQGLVETVDTVLAAYRKRVPTGELNRFFEEVLATRPPPTMGGRAPRLFYVTQAESSPPVFVVVSSAPDAVHFSYQRFVVNQLRKRFGFEGVPIRVVYRGRRRERK